MKRKYVNRRFTLLNPPKEVRKAEFNRAGADIAQTNHFCPGDLPGQNTHAFQADIFAQRLLVLHPKARRVEAFGEDRSRM